MDYIDKIFSRLDLQHIREFLLNGTESVALTGKNYQERIEEARQPVIDRMRIAYPDLLDPPEIDTFYRAISVSQEVYMEIGIQAGAILMMQLLGYGRKEGRD